MQLRKLKASALVTPRADLAALLVAEQASAIGSFPGPCPVIYSGNEASVDTGLTAVVANDDTTAVPEGADIIRRVTSVEDIDESAGAFLVDADPVDLSSILEKMPSSAIVLLAVESMQAENTEIHDTKVLVAKHAGKVHAILLKNAIVGDAEDLEYVSFVVDGLTKKKSSTFNMSGLTGSTNGHFGGVASSRPVTWRRTK